MDAVRNLWTAIYSLADDLLGNIGDFAIKLMDIMSSEVGNTGISILSMMLGVGITVFITKTIAHWVVDFI